MESNEEQQQQNPENIQGQEPTNPQTNTEPEQSEEQASFQSRIDLGPLKEAVDAVKTELRKVIVGQEALLELLIVSVLADGHALIEGVPGVAKTVTAKLLARTMDVGFSRIQFTPDLMPSDILGTSVFNVKNSEFEFKPGPVFSNIILIDEINRAPAKTQAALFEVMEEKQITLDGHRYEMSLPFLVFATQNPIEQEGTYALPEAQLDRFLFKIQVPYPNLDEEVKILENEHQRSATDMLDEVKAVLNAKDIAHYQDLIKDVVVEPHLLRYIAAITDNTRANMNLYLGASPRASLAMLNASKALAAMQGRDFVTPDDIKRIAPAVLRHRIILAPEREMEGVTTDQVVLQLVEAIEIPR